MRAGIVTCLAVGVMAAFVCAGQAATYNVKEYGALGDGKRDDTKSIRDALNAANNAEGVNTVYFPKGTYAVNDIPLSTQNRGAPGLDKDPKDLILRGDGPHESVLQRKATARPDAPIGTAHRAENILVRDLGFDSNGIDRFGGYKFYTSKRITITNCRFIDSNEVPINGYDRFGFILLGCQDVEITSCHLDGMQVEIDNCQRVKVLGNIVAGPRETGGIGIWGHGKAPKGELAEDHLFKDNWIIDPSGVNAGAFVVQVDGVKFQHCRFRNIKIVDNVIIYGNRYQRKGKFAPPALKLGIPDNSREYVGMVFDNIQFEGNRIYLDPASVTKKPPSFIWGNASGRSGFTFDNVTLKNNTVYGAGKYVDIRQKGKNYVEEGNKMLAYEASPKPPEVLKPAAR
ncbi:MAG: right-handed parallel beta-helix repeat-containing protein [Kiritimatiellae bacterium]|nr:right-handed parallel beta-helix repeat-containing protein [Kiritimatiellia bacterium]